MPLSFRKSALLKKAPSQSSHILYHARKFFSFINLAPALKKSTPTQFSSNSGQTLLEVVIATAILVMLASAFFSLIVTSYQILGQSRAQAIARALATEKLELIHNLPYNSIGTSGGIPSGSLPQQEVITRNGQNFTVLISIIYKDDPLDGVSPDDLVPVDYKNVRIQVNWGGAFPTNQSLILVSDIAPKGIENTVGGGTLYVLVFDSQGQPVPQANVSIQAPTANPAVNLSLSTDNSGNLVLPGMPQCTACYHISVTKTNYSSDRTYTTSEVTNPNSPPLTILTGQLSQASFAIDQLSSVTFGSVGPRDSGYPSLPQTNFHLTSNKTIGTDSQSEPVYKLDQDFTTDANGQLIQNLEWDTYQLSLNPNDYHLAGTNPLSPLNITAGLNQSVSFVAASPSPHTLLTQVLDASGSAIASASAKLTGNSYDQTLYTGDTDTPDFGHAFFSPLSALNYSLEIQHPNYETATIPIDISGPTTEVVILNPL